MARKKNSFHCKSDKQKKAIAASYAKRSLKEKDNSVNNQSANMFLAKIRNRYMYTYNNPNGEHTYAVYTDFDTNEVRAVPTTHLYIPDEINMQKLRKGLLCKVKFDGYDTPSGVNNYYYTKNVNGDNIDLTHSDIRLEGITIPRSVSDKIKSFVKYNR